MMKIPVRDQRVHEIGIAQPQRHGSEGYDRKNADGDPHPMRSERARSSSQLGIEDRDNDQEAHGIAIAGRDVAGTQLSQRQDEASDHGPGDVAEPAEDHDRKCLDGREIAHLPEDGVEPGPAARRLRQQGSNRSRRSRCR